MSELETVRGLAHGALEALEQSRERIDDLNVYPFRTATRART